MFIAEVVVRKNIGFRYLSVLHYFSVSSCIIFVLAYQNLNTDLSDLCFNGQDSFYQNLTPEELTKVHEYNFDHPG